MRDVETFAIIGAAMEVHRELGPGFLEAVYQEALAHEFSSHGIAYHRELALPVHYKGVLLDCSYRADFICFGAVIVELKTVDRLGRGDAAQILNYLKATGISKGLLLNFKSESLEYKRFIHKPSSVKSA